MEKILITGSTGKLGSELSELFADSLRPTPKEFDISNKENVYSYIKEQQPDSVIHLAALTDVKECETNKELTWKTNVLGTHYLVDACAAYVKNCYFVFMSTPCIFSGVEGNYTEDSFPSPKNFYSLTKLLGEMTVRHGKIDDWLVVRGNFVSRGKWPYPKAFVDRYGTYLFADQIARAIKEVIDAKLKGIVHLVGDKKLSMFELARINTPDIRPMTLKEYSGPSLTVDMSLDTVRWKKYSIEDY